MKRKITSIIATLPMLLLAYSASAHDPKGHTKKPEKANCAAMEKMRIEKQDKGEKLDMTNSIVLAMMKRCSKNKKHDDMPQHSDEKKHSDGKNDLIKKHPDKEKQPQSGSDKADSHH